jgi:hypothetical protein
LARMEGLEPPRAALETAALPVELHPHRTGDESRTRYLQCGRLTCILLHLTGLWTENVVRREGFVPRPQIKNLVLSQLS